MHEDEAQRLRIDVWVDVVCPFCFIGKRRLERALDEMGIAPQDVDVVFHAYELDPTIRASRPLMQHLEQKFGGEAQARAVIARASALGREEGLDLAFDRAISARTFDAHRVALLAQRSGRGRAMMDRLMQAHFFEGLDVDDPLVLARLGGDAGLDPEEVTRMLKSNDLGREVREDQGVARDAEIRGVPFFVLDGQLVLSGAQPMKLFKDALTLVLREREQAREARVA